MGGYALSCLFLRPAIAPPEPFDHLGIGRLNRPHLIDQFVPARFEQDCCVNNCGGPACLLRPGQPVGDRLPYPGPDDRFEPLPPGRVGEDDLAERLPVYLALCPDDLLAELLDQVPVGRRAPPVGLVAEASASITTAPSFLRTRAASLFPVPMVPVRPIFRMSARRRRRWPRPLCPNLLILQKCRGRPSPPYAAVLFAFECLP